MIVHLIFLLARLASRVYCRYTALADDGDDQDHAQKDEDEDVVEVHDDSSSARVDHGSHGKRCAHDSAYDHVCNWMASLLHCELLSSALARPFGPSAGYSVFLS